ncbi:protein bark beetle isoform X1 [Musca domestica]|uniref:Protein bark beetle isoform X1 n=2 Tax=Musca domestica TaxID=7370 RepID=A0ABM3UUD1_MUSDO|nr:protein bark beetle isoform X1 [Musca domestica]XP_058977121.1 protein bark beetle isoform X1 [Musca domestica]XP_058977122.1 protein bark beetle isoform X1 [Musca domestica]
MTSRRRHHTIINSKTNNNNNKYLETIQLIAFNFLLLFLLATSVPTSSGYAQNSELYESSEFLSANSQYDADDPDFRADNQLHFVPPPLPTTSTPRRQQEAVEENVLSFSYDDSVPPLMSSNPATDVGTSSSSSTTTTTTYTELSGGSITSDRVLRSSESPYAAREHIIVEKGAKLIIEPGVRIEFAPTVGITVRGILHAVGTPTARITLTAQGHNVELPDVEERGIRLVDGPTPLEGRLEIFHKGAWRPVCTNSRNWTMTDYAVACRQMGFQGGRFWNWVDRSPGWKPRLLYELPNCKGTENSLLDCDWSTRQLGSGVCDYHSDIGIQCKAMHNLQLSHWAGLYFENAPTTKTLAKDNTVYYTKSQSTLKYVDILRAGNGLKQATKAAIESVGVPPQTQHVVITHSAYTGFNATRPYGGFALQNVTIRKSNGIGLFVNSSQGYVQLSGCNIQDNAGDGVKYVGHDLRVDERPDRSSIYDFCTLPTTSGQTYPLTLSFTQKFYAGSAKECSKYFFSKPGYVLTVQFEQFTLKNNDTASVEIYDGASANDRLLFVWSARNYSRPQSVTSTREKLFVRIKAAMREEILGFIRITTGETSAFDLRVLDSVVQDNGGRGIAVDSLRSRVHLHGSSISGNGHVAGFHVTSGAGDVNITETNISYNHGSGVNITYVGGNRNISRSYVDFNKGYGIAVWLNETTDPNRVEYLAFNQTTAVEYSHINSNLDVGVLHGNFCQPLWVNLTGNFFNGSAGNDIRLESCWKSLEPKEPNMFLQIGHNSFENSQQNAIYLSPALNMRGRIEFNQFRYGMYGCIYIRNDFIYQEFNFMPVHLVIQSNYFSRNKGVHVVSLGLSPYSRREVQHLLFSRNFVRENKITEFFGPLLDGSEGSDGAGRLNPRSRVAAAVVVSSSNVDIFRNILNNLDSAYEIGSQLSDQSQIINATYNWLGSSEEVKIFSRLFHRNDRYNLAKIQYIPYLLHSSNPGSSTVIYTSTFVPRFYVENSEYIGGEVDGQEMIPPGTYTVNKDINIRPGGKLILQPGVTLQFEPSVGMMVAGKLEARGRRPDDIFLTLKRQPIMDVDSSTLNHDLIDMIDMETESIMSGGGGGGVDEIPKVPVRLLGGAGPYEGRLQLYVNDRWGTVCDYGWTELNAALVCHHLGYTLNPKDWRLLRSQMPAAGLTEDVIVSNVQCTEHDRDITRCKAEYLWQGDFENSCSHENDVGIRCYEGAWAGVRFSMLAERADLQYVTIEKAGLFDYTTNSFKPALQMDFARHNLDNVRIVDNLDDGLGVIYADLYGGKAINNIRNSEFVGNRGSGISLKQLDFRIQGSIIKNNLGSGISHDPVIAAKDQFELGGWFKMAVDFNSFESNYEPFVLPRDEGNIELGTWESKYVRTEEVRGGENVEKKFHIRCPAGYVLGIQLLNPINNLSTESLKILNSQSENPRAQLWDVRRDLNVFPTTSSGYGIIIYYESGDNALGGAVLMLTTVQAPVQNIRNRIVGGPVPSLHIRSTKIQKNLRGISALYYNRYYGSEGELYMRKANESIKIVNSELSNNDLEAILINSPYWDVISSNLSEITVHVNNSKILQNGYGIRQLSKDLRSSNNLFHYVVQDTTVEDNKNGGFQVSLPYVWQYNENFTHSIHFGNTTWQRNRNFYIDVSGHYADFNITSNAFLNNQAPRSLISVMGMEKRMKFSYNRIEQNQAKFIMEFKADSLSEKFGEVHALVEYNTIKQNNNYEVLRHLPALQHARKQASINSLNTAVIRLDGIQNVKLYRNLIAENSLRYNLVAGLRSARVDNYVYATENWWGSTDISQIEGKIFDFDNWNDHADVIYQPFLIEDTMDASISLVKENRDLIDLNRWQGGRIYSDLVLRKREYPYIIRNDITVMPEATLTIHHGVQMEFEPNVGMLVLGTLNAIGYEESPIIMKPFKNATHESYSLINKRALDMEMEQLQAYDSIRLCTNSQNCSSDMDKMFEINQGFLEYFNHTTLQWVPICDSRFTERNAQVVCRELGYDPLNVYYSHDRRIEFHTNSLTRIWTWVQPLECRGDEIRMSDCEERLNGQVYGHRHECHWDDVFVFVSCAGVPEDEVYWGGIRFTNSEFEQNQYEQRYHDIHTHGLQKHQQSRLEFVRIENAGILHNQKSAAIQAIYKTPSISAVTIKNSANHGLNFVVPSGALNLNLLNISQALGSGINILSLTGEGRESDESSFTPLKKLDLPYKLFSMIDICDPQKTITVEERVLLYYKYDNNPVNCVKMFTSAYRAKPLGFRLLQSNLFNHSKLYGRMDSIRLYDGDVYNVTSLFMGQIESDTNNQKSFFKTEGPTLSVHLMASGAPEYHGFIAEVVTVPISTIGINRDALHNVTYSHISGAIKGAVVYTSAGEVTPTLTLTSNRIERNCLQLYGNFSTCDAALNVDVQNMNSFFFMNNLLLNNQGGLKLRADSRGSATSLRGFIHHNLFLKNRNRPALFVEGRQSSPYQEVELYRNYFAQNQAGYEDVIRLRQVVSNFSYNYVHSNVGGRIVEVSGFEKVRLPIYQSTAHNGFYRNIATNWMGRATIVAGTAGQQYVDNIFENPDNDYEIITVNSSILSIDYRNSTIELWKSKIDARHNYWSYNNTLSVQSRIKDKSDDPMLLEVLAVPFQMNNQTILDGKCPPGWSQVSDTCFMYVGVPMTFHEAKEFCRSENSSMPFIRTDSTTLWIYLQSQMRHLKYPEKVWVQDFNYIDRCTSFAYMEITVEECNKELGFICEVDPKVVIDPLSWRADIFAISIISAFVLALILLILVGICWYAKSKHRHAQRLQRRNSIRQSLRSLNSIDPQGSLRRRNFNMSNSTGTLTKSMAQDYKMMGNGSFESIDKSVLSSEASFEPYENHRPNGGEKSEYNTPQKSQNEYVTSIRTPGSAGGLMGPPRVATIGSASRARGRATAAALAAAAAQQKTPQNDFELSYRNEGFRDNSTYSGTRNNSISTSIAEDTPIIHQTDAEETGSDYYGNASTLPLRYDPNENLAFLSELKRNIPEDQRSSQMSDKPPSTFLPPTVAAVHQHRQRPPKTPSPPTNQTVSSNNSTTGSLTYEQKIDNMNFSSLAELRSNNTSQVSATAAPADIRRPDSYMVAVGANRFSRPASSIGGGGIGGGSSPKYDTPTLSMASQLASRRPKTVYENSDSTAASSTLPHGHHQDAVPAYHRSRSEALLETDLDMDNSPPMDANGRCHSQPLETSM